MVMDTTTIHTNKNKHMNREVSIILPVYNCEKFIGKTIESILNQTFPNFELLILNDGSNDQSLNVIQEFNDDRIQIISRENKGLISTLNELVDYASSDIIARIDGDDICELDRIEKQLNKIREGYDIVSSNAYLIDINDNIIGETRYPSSQRDIISHMVYNSPLIHPAVMAKKQVFNIKYSHEDIYAEDYELWIKAILEYGYTAYSFKESLIRYRIHSDSVCNSNQDKQIEISNFIRQKIKKNIIDNFYGGALLFIRRDNSTPIIQLALSSMRYMVSDFNIYRLKISCKIIIKKILGRR